jgi:putative ABC transport system permease protein
MSFRRFFHRREWDEERHREIQAYIDIETDDNLARGMSPEDARSAAFRKFGNPTLVREEIYRMNTVTLVENVFQDVAYGARQLRRNPSFALVAVLSLALGIGANTAIFQLLNAVRLRSLPVQNPQELVDVRVSAGKSGRTGSFSTRYPFVTNSQWELIRDRQQVFSGAFAWAPDQLNLATGGQVRWAQAIYVSGGYFNVLGVVPELGRVLSAADDYRGCGSQSAVISNAFWQREFGGEASALGRKITLEGHAFEVVGVTPPNFYGVEVGRQFDVAIPLCADTVIRGEFARIGKNDEWWLSVTGRLKPGLSEKQAKAQLSAIGPAIFKETVPATFTPGDAKNYLTFSLDLRPAGTGVSELRFQYQEPLWLLLGIAGLVLLIACANLANLLLARATAREREIAVRQAIGASRPRILAQLLSESLLLAGTGAALGALLAQWLSRVLVSLLTTGGQSLFVDLGVDWRVLSFTAGLAVLTCVLFGLAPALRATKVEPGVAMKAGGRGLTTTRERFGLRRTLVVSQVALSTVLLVGALLFVRSLNNLLTVDPGFQQEGIVEVDMDFTALKVSAERRYAFQQDLMDRIRAIPGVIAAGQSSEIPLSGSMSNRMIHMQGPGAVTAVSLLNNAGPDYFRTLGTPLLKGRDFGPSDTPQSPKAAIVNEAFARQFLHGADPIGRQFRLETPPGKPNIPYQIVGLVKNAKYNDLREDFAAIVYVPISQAEVAAPGGQVLVRSTTSSGSLISDVKGVIAGVSPEIALDFHVFKTQIRDGLLRDRLMATVSGFFGLLAALLATVGLYGVMSYSVERRRNEIGIRMALGASRGGVTQMVMREAATLLSIGLTIGAVLALLGARAASAMLFGLKAYDPVTLATALVALAASAMMAAYLPARRAANLEPMTALRED